MVLINRSVLVFIIISWFTPVSGQNQSNKGIQFFAGSWTELLKTAQEQKKMIFIDVYTDWCGPCKEMDKFIFPLEEVGKKYNPVFINYKLNAEKGDGTALAKKFNISAYPTFLFLDSDGFLIQRVAGERAAAEFNLLVDEVIKIKDKNKLSNMEAGFTAGNRDLNFLRTYIAKLKELDIDNSIPLDEYFKAIPTRDLKKEETLVFLAEHLFGVQTKSFLHVMENYDNLSQAAKDRLQLQLYNQMVDRSAPLVLSQNKFLEFRQILNYISKINPLTEKQERYLSRLKLAYYDLTRDMEHLKSESYNWIEKIKDISADSIHSEDVRQYQKFIIPFLQGKQDSTKHADYQEVKEMMKSVYSKGIAYKYYYPASLFISLPEDETTALNDALNWAIKAQALDPKQKPYQDLVALLKQRLKLQTGSN